MAVPEDLQKWRKDKGLTQKDAAAHVGVSAPSWCDWEAGKKVPDIESAETLERVTGIPMAAWAEFSRTRRAPVRGTGTEG